MYARMRLALLAAMFAVMPVGGARGQTAPCSGVVLDSAPYHLRAVLQAFCIQSSMAPPFDLNEQVQYAGYNADNEFLLAYQTVSDSARLDERVHIARLDKLTRKWSATAFSQIETEILPGLTAPCLGAVGGLQKAGELFYVSIELSPSAGCVASISSDLKLQKVLSGWIVANFASGAVILEGSTVHFAPTHPLRLSLFNPSDGSVSSIYPIEKDPLRARYIQSLLTEIVPGDRCEGESCERNPEHFDDELANVCQVSRCRPAIAVNDETGSFAFMVQFNPIGFLSFQKTKDATELSEQVVFVYRITDGNMEYREFPAREMPAQFDVTSIDALLAPEILNRVFVN